jgi:hypothetical protein
MVLFMVPLPLGVGGLRRGKLWVIATPGENMKNPEQRHPDRWRQWNSRRRAYRIEVRVNSRPIKHESKPRFEAPKNPFIPQLL